MEESMVSGHGRDSNQELEEMGKRIKTEYTIDAAASSSPKTTTTQNSNTMGRRVQVVGPPPGTALNTVTPCAACKLLRRRCAEECPFSPYFSPHEPQKFAAVHKVFGASNVSKMLLEVAESHRADTANSLVYEANVRLRDPVYGCMGAISALQRQIQTLQSELNFVRSAILKFKYTEATVATNSSLLNPASTATMTAATPPHHLVGGGGASIMHHHHQPQPPTTPSSTTGGFSSISSDSVAYFD